MRNAPRWCHILSNPMRIACLALAGLAVVSCQSSPSEPERGRAVYTADLPPIVNDWARPERGVLHVGKDSASREVTDKVGSVDIELDAPPSDTAVLSLWRGGVLIHDLDYVYDGSFKLRYTGRYRSNAVALAIFARIHPASSHQAFVSEFARLLVANDSVVRTLGFPSQGIPGVDSGEVLREAMKIVVASGKPLAEIVPATGPWALGLDSAGIRQRVRDLVREGSLSADTTKLFAPPVPPDTTAPSLRFVSPSADTVLGNAVARLDVRVAVIDVSGIDSVWIGGKIATRKGDTWIVEGLDIPVSERGTAIEARARDTKGNSVSGSILVRREAAVVSSPTVRLLSPLGSAAILPAGQERIVLRWLVTDLVGIPDSGVRIEGQIAQVDRDTFRLDVPAPAPGTARTYRIVAVNAQGNRNTDSVVITRTAAARDTVPPVVVRQPGTKDTTVANAVASYTLGWKVTDNVGLRTVRLNGAVVAGDSSSFRQTVSLVPGANWFMLTAWDSAGNVSTDTLVVIRAAAARDTLPPVVVRQPGTKDTTVANAVASYTLGWKVTDNVALRTVRLNGAVVAGDSNSFRQTVSLVPGANWFMLTAWDSAGNVSTDTLVVIRAAAARDTLPPVVVRQPGTKDTTVANAVASYTLGWKVTDDRALRSVVVNGVEMTESMSVYTRTVPLLVGRNAFVLVATDTSGNIRRDTVVITRAAAARDTVPPVVVRQPGTTDTSVANGVASYTLDWKVTDNVALRTVRINGSVVAGESDRFRQTVSLVPGANWFMIAAWDSAGNISTDTLLITRASAAGDTVRPVVVRQPGTKDTTVANAVTSYTLGWKVTDDRALRSVVVNGVEMTESMSVYTRTVPLLVGRNAFVLVATDTSGNIRRDTVVITRAAAAGDLVRPVVVRQPGTKDTTVASSTASYTVGWTVTDNVALHTVRINGAVVAGESGRFRQTVSLEPGANWFMLTARDSAGNVSTDTVCITRAAAPRDSLAPMVVRQTGTKDTTVANAVTSYTLGWKVTDDRALRSVVVNGVAVTGSMSVYSKAVPLAVGRNAIVLAAFDTSGNVSTDTVVITRAADGVAPVLSVSSPDRDTVTVPNDSLSFTITWKATDDQALASVTLDGVAIVASATGYSRVVVLVVGENRFTLQATDASGNSTRRTVTIFRQAAIVP